MQRRRLLGVAAVLAVSVMAQNAVPTSAAWNDAEWGNARVTTASCANTFDARGEGRILSGSALTLNLDDVAEAAGVTVVNDGTTLSFEPADAVELGDDAYADPLRVSLLQDAITAGIGPGILKLPLENSTGAANQYAAAHNNGVARGASGYVTDSGAISTDTASGYPDLATLSLSRVVGALNHDVGELLSGVTDADLTFGALAGRAELDECTHRWSGDLGRALTRDYLLASLRTELAVPAVSSLTQHLSQSVDTLERIVNGFSSNPELARAIESLLGPIIENLLGLGVSIGSVRLTSLSAAVDTEALRTLIDTPFGDTEGIVEIAPATGTVAVDLAALLGRAYPDEYARGLNGLPANTNLLNDPGAADSLADALSDALGSWVERFTRLLEEVIDAVELEVVIKVDLNVAIALLVLPLTTLTITVTGNLADLSVDASNSSILNPVPGVDQLLNALITALTGVSAGLVSGLVSTAVIEALAPVRLLVQGLSDLTHPIIAAVTGLYHHLFLDGVVSLVVNAQNHAHNGSTGPRAWAGLPSGRYDVAAVHLSVFDLAGRAGIDLYFGRGSAGADCPGNTPTSNSTWCQ